MNIRQLNNLMNKFHVGFVKVSIATTLAGTAFIAYGFYHLKFQVRPKLLEEEKIAQEDLLKEGRETIADTASELKL